MLRVHGLNAKSLLRLTPEGLYCAAGDFHIDPVRAVKRAVITHAHADHARQGSHHYLCARPGEALLRHRMASGASIRSIAYGERLKLGDAMVSLHPAGHILGSAQVRIEVSGEVWVVSGDYNTGRDHGCGAPFEAVACHTFITESTFALPVYRWPAVEKVFGEIHQWWRRNADRGITSVLPAYPLGKSQRLLAHLDNSIGPVVVHENIRPYLEAYRDAGVRQVEALDPAVANPRDLAGRALVITSSAAGESQVLEKLGPLSRAFASGWMMTRAARRNRSFDRGFVLSDHADWDGLIHAIRATGAGRVGVMHGETEIFTRWLREQGWEAFPV